MNVVFKISDNFEAWLYEKLGRLPRKNEYQNARESQNEVHVKIKVEAVENALLSIDSIVLVALYIASVNQDPSYLTIEIKRDEDYFEDRALFRVLEW